MIRKNLPILTIVAVVILAVAACQSYPEGSLEALKHDQWKKVYKECVKRSVHANPQLALYVDLGAVSDGCAKLAKDLVGK